MYIRCEKLALLLIIALALPVAAEDVVLNRNQADEIIKELRQIRQLLQKQADGSTNSEPHGQGTTAKVKLGLANMLGSRDAPVTIVEFIDYECPFCQRFHLSTFVDLKKNYIDTGKVRFYSRGLPIDGHPHALLAAQSARCAGEQGGFWNMRETMITHSDKLDSPDLMEYAANIKLDLAAFRSCMDTEKYKDAVQVERKDAMGIGVQGTPSFILGPSTVDGVEGDLFEGALPYAVFDQKLKQLMARLKSAPVRDPK